MQPTSLYYVILTLSGQLGFNEQVNVPLTNMNNIHLTKHISLINVDIKTFDYPDLTQ